jgi:hypothetical protein
LAAWPEHGFADTYQPGKPVIPQIEAWAKSNNVTLVSPFWKVELAKRMKQTLLSKSVKPIPGDYMKNWETLFATLLRGEFLQ